MNYYDDCFEDVTSGDATSGCWPCNPCSPDAINDDGSQCWPCNPCSPDQLEPGGGQCWPCNPCSPDQRDDDGSQCWPCNPCSPDQRTEGGGQCLPCNPCCPDQGEASSESGNSSNCFITSACVESMGLPDDCEVLQTLRALRDKRTLYDPYFCNLVKDYYRIAPLIVKAINCNTNRKTIYRMIYETMILPCVSLIKDNRENEAIRLYAQTVLSLKEQHCINS